MPNIPKIIHYCWYGPKKWGFLEQDCLDSWHALLPDYQFRLWNEDSLDLRVYPFAWEAYKVGKFAFVSDVVRLHALYAEGGIYLDTDIFLLKRLDDLLDDDFFTSEYRTGSLASAVIGSVPSHPLLNRLLGEYKGLNFDFLRPKMIPDVFDEVIWKYEDKSVKIYSSDYFYSLPFEEKGKDFSSYLTENSYAVHLWNHSWKDEFGLLREDRFFSSIRVVIYHSLCYPRTYFKPSYFKRYGEQFNKHLKRFLKAKMDG